MASSFNMPCVQRNFLLLMTGIGKGLFNIFVGVLLVITASGKLEGLIGGCAIAASGCIFLFLSYFKNMKDDDLNRALSIYATENKKAMKKGATDAIANNKDKIYDVAYNNKDVIAKVAMDNQDVIGQVAFDNKELIAESYLKN